MLLVKTERHHRGHGHFTDGANYVAGKPWPCFSVSAGATVKVGEVVHNKAVSPPMISAVL